MVILVKFELYNAALEPSDELGILQFMVNSPVQYPNALSPIEVTPLPMTVFSKPLQSLNA